MRAEVERRGLLGILGVYAVVAAALLPAYGDQLDFDQVGYLRLAQRWADLEWSKAVSAHWSPVLSWLEAPLLWVGVDPGLAATAIGALAGALVTVLAWLILRRWHLDAATRLVGVAIIAVLVLTWGLARPFPADVLAIAAVLAVVLALPDRLPVGRRRAVLIGALVAVGYLVKAFLLPYLLLGLALVVVAAAWTGGRASWRPLARAVGWGAAGLAAVAGPWVVVLSLTYDEPTVSTAAEFNLGVLEPGDPDTSPFLIRAQPLPHADSLTVWEDPARNEPLSWNPFGSVDDLRAYVDVTGGNLERAQAIIVDFSLLAPAVAAAGLVAAVGWPRRRRELALLLGGATLYVGGYILIYVVSRYLLPALVLLALLAAVVLTLGREAGWSRRAWVVAAGLWAVTVLYGPVVEVVSNLDNGGINAPAATSWATVRSSAAEIDGALPDDARLLGSGVDGVQMAHVICVDDEVTCLGGLVDDDRSRAAAETHGATHVVVPAGAEGPPPLPGARLDPALSTDAFTIWVI